MTPNVNTYTAFCQESGGNSTVWIDTVQADDMRGAVKEARNACAVDWGVDPDDVHVLGIAAGDVQILYWCDQEDDK